MKLCCKQSSTTATSSAVNFSEFEFVQAIDHLSVPLAFPTWFDSIKSPSCARMLGFADHFAIRGG